MNTLPQLPTIGEPSTFEQGDRIRELLRRFQAQSKGAMGVYRGFTEICPPRLRVNTYFGCAFQCKFCYAWYHGGRSTARPERRVLKNLPEDIDLAISLGISHLPVMVSCSCDPLQPLEQTHRCTLRVLELLSESQFPIIVITQNPRVLLEERYLLALRSTKSTLEVTIPSMNAGLGGTGIFESSAPPALERFDAMKSLATQGVTVRLRIDPVIPRLDEHGPGQSHDDIRELVRLAVASGASLVISKPMRLAAEILPQIMCSLLPYYGDHRSEPPSSVVPVDLDQRTQKQLLDPVWNACRESSIRFCPCVSNVTFDETVPCWQADGIIGNSRSSGRT